MELKLTKTQKKHIDSVRWLFSEDLKDRQSGRTMLLAYVYIERAMGGIRTRIHDHTGFDHASAYVLTRYIEDIIKENNLPLKIKRSTMELLLEKN